MRKELRGYQKKAVDDIKQWLPENKDPLLVTASVGAGKSLIIAEILRWIEQSNSNYKVLCLTLNSTLIQQNSETYQSQGGTCGIYCAGLNEKCHDKQIIFGSPQSVCKSIKNKDPIADVHFNLVVVDEAHNISPYDRETMFQRIINHYGIMSQTYGHSYRVIGLTGTPYRGKGISIVGKDQFFRDEICNINTSWLISQGYLVKPFFGLPEAQGYDFSNIRVNSMGKFSGAELEAITASNTRLTGLIMKELQKIMQTRRGAFIFLATRKHCEEAYRSLPERSAAVITGETPHDKRREILLRANSGDIRFLLSVNCLTVGIDIPSFDVAAWLRPTESLILYTQGIGRVLRLHPGKTEALVLDYAGNLTRHGDIDDPIINEALQPTKETEHEYIIPCLSCAEKGIQTLNTLHNRRCIAVIDGKRCDHFFEWKDCNQCSAKNDKCSRQCRECGAELIDPNEKLVSKAARPELISIEIESARYWITDVYNYPQWNCMYHTKEKLKIYESFTIRDSRTKNIFYGVWLKHHVINSSQYYPVIESIPHLRKLLESGDIRTPHTLECQYENNRYKIKRRKFYDIDADIVPELQHMAVSTTG